MIEILRGTPAVLSSIEITGEYVTATEGDAPPRVIAVSLHEGPEYRAAVLRSGAEDMICKREFSKMAPGLIGAMADAGDAS